MNEKKESEKKNYAWVTLIATDNFAEGAIMLKKSLDKVKSKYPLYIIATNNLSLSSLNLFEQYNIPYKIFPYMSFYCEGNRNQNYWEDIIDQKENIYWNCTICKNYMFLFTEFKKVCFLDADIEFKQNCDYYFQYPHFSAFKSPFSPEYISPYGAVIIIKPSINDFFKSMSISMQKGVCNDEMVWDKMFPNFKEKSDHQLPYKDIISNDNITIPNNIKILHHDGPIKPWMKKEIDKNDLF